MLSFVAQGALCAALILTARVCMCAQREYVAEEVEKLKATDGGRNSRKSIGPGLCVHATSHTCRGRGREGERCAHSVAAESTASSMEYFEGIQHKTSAKREIYHLCQHLPTPSSLPSTTPPLTRFTTTSRPHAHHRAAARSYHELGAAVKLWNGNQRSAPRGLGPGYSRRCEH